MVQSQFHKNGRITMVAWEEKIHLGYRQDDPL